MSFNYTNLGNILPLYNALASNANSIAGHSNFANPLNAAITTTAVGPIANATSTTTLNIKHKPPDNSQKVNTSTVSKMKPNQGAAPMDLENDSEVEIVSNNIVKPTNVKVSKHGDEVNKIPMNMHDPNLYLNSLMSTGLNASGYMFFPTAAGIGPNTTAAATNSMLMDTTTMMAAAMQQMQQAYPAGYGITENNLEAAQLGNSSDTYNVTSTTSMKEVIKTKSCILFPPNPNAPPPTIRERPLGCRTVFVGGLPENITEEIIREIFESCGEITTLRMSKKNFCHIRYRHESAIDRAIYLSGYRVRISNVSEPANFGRLHVDYAQARDDQYDYECKQRQVQREQRHRELMSHDRLRSQSPPPIPHYSDHESTLVAENLRNNETFLKAVQTITVWLERGDCSKRNANVFYSMIQSTHAHVRRLHADKQQLEDDLRKARECYRKQMLTMSTQFTQIEKVFNAASHKKVWDHFTKAQRKNIDQWKKFATELRSIQIEDDEMEMSDDERDNQSGHTKRTRYDSEGLKDENDSLRCQLEAIRNEMSLERTDIKYDSDFREKQIKVLQETIRNMQTQLLQTKLREQKDLKTIEHLERKLKQAAVKQLLLKTKIRETEVKSKDKDKEKDMGTPSISDTSEILCDEHELPDCDEVDDFVEIETSLIEKPKEPNYEANIIDIDLCKSDEDIRIVEDQGDVVEIHEIDDDDKQNQISESRNSITKKDLNVKQNSNSEDKITSETCKKVDTTNEVAKLNVCTALELTEAKIIALTTAYLVVQPFGMKSDAICAYVVKMMKSTPLETKLLNNILQKYNNLFKADEITADSSLNIHWRFCGFLEADQN
ncbi:ecto-NOX disulfide-thiol exchanger 2 [Teleopsis dalmanni]|uniref:ecto-NOX disulfide-thiol exchanger 2 n=1 Tax=Teleopsis dalmanni TaxID=139649 RepID=UPI000D329888|nr:ecto-NOX disulfide-thiol exchanger 2 [Teleopsis dalmanni]